MNSPVMNSPNATSWPVNYTSTRMVDAQPSKLSALPLMICEEEAFTRKLGRLLGCSTRRIKNLLATVFCLTGRNYMHCYQMQPLLPERFLVTDEDSMFWHSFISATFVISHRHFTLFCL